MLLGKVVAVFFLGFLCGIISVRQLVLVSAGPRSWLLALVLLPRLEETMLSSTFFHFSPRESKINGNLLHEEADRQTPLLLPP